ncbi:sigma 54-interacting transcriptional regulator [Desulfosarcina alkanivorans]|uniref:sigma 54-interacting transcriptional regulator n=1 Tax=Desulfosarcina alkanivorans TaxID=571177 RepID=UPI00142F0AE8|nr:sigma 54-interacting transcriptional regulator [Desulfosarcina alkanivorans]
MVLDKDQTGRDDIRNRLSLCGVLPICFRDKWVCLENIYHIRPSFAVLRSDCFDIASDFVNVAKAIRKNIPVIVLSKKREVEAFIHNNWLVNLFFLRYPADDQSFQDTISLLAATKQACDHPVLVAGSAERRKIMRELPLLGQAKDPVLIQGERGVGKRLMARAVHRCSAAKAAPIDFIDASQLSGQWIQKTCAWGDAATPDAASGRVRVIENIENLPLPLQSQLLSVMETFNGNGICERKANGFAPFVTLAGSDLESLAEKGAFRKDLYHRLSVLKVTVPALRGHSADIRALAEYFAARYGIRFNGGIFRLPDEIVESFTGYHWPGNVSELKRTVQDLLVTDKTSWSSLPPFMANAGMKRDGNPLHHCLIDTDEVHDFLEKNRGVSLKMAKNRYVIQVEKKFLKAALAQTNGNCKKAAGLLNISYKSMLNKVKEYQLV